MQIRIEPKNQKRLRDAAKENRRSVASEGNFAIDQYLIAVRLRKASAKLSEELIAR